MKKVLIWFVFLLLILGGNAYAFTPGSATGMADGVDGELITWDASGNITTVAVGTAGQLLKSSGAGAAPTMSSTISPSTVNLAAHTDYQVGGVAYQAADLDTWDKIEVQAQDFYVDGAQCAAVAAASVNSGPTCWGTTCADNAAAEIQFSVSMPQNWDGGSVFIGLYVVDVNATPGEINFDASVQARGQGDVVNNTWITANGNIDTVGLDTQYEAELAINTTAIAAGGSTGGEILFAKLIRDSADASTNAVKVLGAVVFFQIDEMDGKN